LEERFVCTVCGHRGADVRPLFEPARMGTEALRSLEPFGGRQDVWLRSPQTSQAHRSEDPRPPAGLSLVSQSERNLGFGGNAKAGR
jgi:hypothetical protein